RAADVIWAAVHRRAFLVHDTCRAVRQVAARTLAGAVADTVPARCSSRCRRVRGATVAADVTGAGVAIDWKIAIVGGWRQRSTRTIAIHDFAVTGGLGVGFGGCTRSAVVDVARLH